jgi:hypothetical protein
MRPPDARAAGPAAVWPFVLGAVLLAAGAALVHRGSAQDAPGASAGVPVASQPAIAAGVPAATQGAAGPATSALLANPFSPLAHDVARGVPAPPAASPFAYVGTRFERERNVVVLSHRGREVTVHSAGALDADYEVERIDERQVVLLYLPLMTRQVLSLPPPVGPAAPEEN